MAFLWRKSELSCCSYRQFTAVQPVNRRSQSVKFGRGSHSALVGAHCTKPPMPNEGRAAGADQMPVPPVKFRTHSRNKDALREGPVSGPCDGRYPWKDRPDLVQYGTSELDCLLSGAHVWVKG